jgi:hypothetical protein
LSAFLCGRNDSALRSGCGLLRGRHMVFLVDMYLTALVYERGRLRRKRLFQREFTRRMRRGE